MSSMALESFTPTPFICSTFSLSACLTSTSFRAASEFSGCEVMSSSRSRRASTQSAKVMWTKALRYSAFSQVGSTAKVAVATCLASTHLCCLM
eukprot:CAMPEP_0197681842 /NCGR_PEP_ID=MMETSP1338-20131121/95549_1 /TAXON_ID=43686 ORGANISM="Pelagodinium beii, Strain RCC1491" /NCGR_SAMPLE_ID=MMETSP1338 /ASSEMBLY_ACC=CAM_ASM_000754 /LENGTH=92 /DNA_ID=CAMNT_0043263233 /DNA_START=102 /DNA_END=380 /DNA_ORIENTATION=+